MKSIEKSCPLFDKNLALRGGENIMINKKIMMSSFSIVAALSLVSAGAFAAFTSEASSSNNVFASGTLKIFVDDDNESAAASVTSSIGNNNMAPGGTPVSGYISIDNGGTLNISDVDLKLDASVNQGGDGIGDIRNALNLTFKTGDDTTCTTNSVDHTGAMATVIGNGISPLTLGEFNGNTYQNILTNLGVSDTKYLCITAQLDANAGNELQGDSSSVTFTVTGNQ